MNPTLEILLPLVIVCGIAVFVVLRMVNKMKKGTLGKKKSTSAQMVLDSLIPLGMIAGTVMAIFLSLLTPISLISAMKWGPGIGLLFGYVAYEIYSKMDVSYS